MSLCGLIDGIALLEGGPVTAEVWHRRRPAVVRFDPQAAQSPTSANYDTQEAREIGPAILWRPNITQLIEDRFVRELEVNRITALSRTTRWRLERAGKFPQRYQLSANAVGWLLSEILAWRSSRPTRGGE